jgi:hypothetical protein
MQIMGLVDYSDVYAQEVIAGRKKPPGRRWDGTVNQPDQGSQRATSEQPPLADLGMDM